MLITRPTNLVTKNKALEELLTFDDGKVTNEFFASNKIRCAIVGPSGCGKTTFLINRLLESGRIDWMQIKIMAPIATLTHPSYEAFKANIDEHQEKIQDKLDDLEYPYDTMCELIDVSNPHEIPRIEEFAEGIKHVVIIDDFIASSKDSLQKINDLMIAGSKRDMSIFLLIQNLKISKLTTARRNLDSFILFKGTNITAIEEVCDLAGICRKNVEKLNFYLNQKERNYLMVMLNAPMERKFMLGEDKYYIPIECGNQTIKGGSIAGMDGIGQPNFDRKIPIAGQSRYLCFKNKSQWEVLLRNHMLEYRIGNDSTPPYIAGLIKAGEDIGWESQWMLEEDGSPFDNKSGQIFDAIFVPDRAALERRAGEHGRNMTLYLSLINFGADNGWVDKAAASMIMREAMSKY